MDDDGVGSWSPMKRREARRAMLRGALAIGVGLPLLDLCARLAPEVSAQGEPRNQRPQAGDRFAFQAGERAGQLITVADLPMGGPPVIEGSRFVLSRTPATFPAAAPSTGGDNDAVLRELLGYDDDAITSLVAAGALE